MGGVALTLRVPVEVSSHLALSSRDSRSAHWAWSPEPLVPHFQPLPHHVLLDLSLSVSSFLFKPPTWQVLLWGHPGPHQNIPKTGSLRHLSDCKLAGSSAHPHALIRTEGWGCQGIFPTRGLNSRPLHRKQILYHGATGEVRGE